MLVCILFRDSGLIVCEKNLSSTLLITDSTLIDPGSNFPITWVKFTARINTRNLATTLCMKFPRFVFRNFLFQEKGSPADAQIGCKDNLGRRNYLATYLRCLFRCYAGDERGTAADRQCWLNQAVHDCSQKKKEEKNRAVHFRAFYSLWKKSISMHSQGVFMNMSRASETGGFHSEKVPL